VSFPHHTGDQPAGLIAPLLAVEVGVHRWDVKSVLGEHQPIPPDLAVDGARRKWLLREFCGAGYAGCRMTRLRSRVKSARSYIWRLTVLILLTVPSTLPEL
jgi:hypothetical protein